LDRPVGGVMVFAKTSKSASRLSEQIRLREFKKSYYAVVHGTFTQKSGSLNDYLLKDSRTNIVEVVSKSTDGAKEALLDYEVLNSVENLSFVRVQLHTGRPHQIRVQFSNSRHPLYGDQKYGMKQNKPGQQIALWSAEIILLHPTQKEEMAFRSAPPSAYPWNLFQKEILN
jgi:23S rRNA pseudouridine1911/1915/1917 synthase